MSTRMKYWMPGTLGALAICVCLTNQAPRAAAQTVERTMPQNDMTTHEMTNRAHNKQVWKASEVIGMNVRSVNGDDNIGSINDLVLGPEGRVKYAAVSFGGFLGMGDKLFAVPLGAIDFIKTDKDTYARIDVTEQTLKAKQGFNQDHWPAEADRSFTSGTTRRQASNMDVSR